MFEFGSELATHSSVVENVREPMAPNADVATTKLAQHGPRVRWGWQIEEEL